MLNMFKIHNLEEDMVLETVNNFENLLMTKSTTKYIIMKRYKKPAHILPDLLSTLYKKI